MRRASHTLGAAAASSVAQRYATRLDRGDVQHATECRGFSETTSTTTPLALPLTLYWMNISWSHRLTRELGLKLIKHIQKLTRDGKGEAIVCRAANLCSMFSRDRAQERPIEVLDRAQEPLTLRKGLITQADFDETKKASCWQSFRRPLLRDQPGANREMSKTSDELGDDQFRLQLRCVVHRKLFTARSPQAHAEDTPSQTQLFRPLRTHQESPLPSSSSSSSNSQRSIPVSLVRGGTTGNPAVHEPGSRFIRFVCRGSRANTSRLRARTRARQWTRSSTACGHGPNSAGLTHSPN